MKTKLFLALFYLTMMIFSFCVGYQRGANAERMQTKSLQISSSEAHNSFMQWKLLDAQRRNDAFQEIIEMERKWNK